MIEAAVLIVMYNGREFLEDCLASVFKSDDPGIQIRVIVIDNASTDGSAALVREKFPQATIVAYDDTPFAFAALRAGNVQAITQDGPKLVGLLANVPDKQNYEIPAFTISNDYMGVGIPKGETRLVGFVNDTLKGLEADGSAATIYNRWFGPQTKTPLVRIFKIGDKT